jgi:predicted RNase H-like nuclease (RuvC/YqgF family)
LQLENKILRAENIRLKKESANLREKLAELETTMSEKILRCVEEAVRLSTAPLQEELHKAHTEISRLKSIINKDSSNSSKPPSTDGFKQKE